MNERYTRLVKNDLPYHHGEIANVGILAGAAWRAGWVALQEFRQEKGANRNARSDLWVKSECAEEFVEAKFAKLWGDPQEAIASEGIRRTLKEATGAAVSVQEDADTTGKISMVFFCPRIQKEDVDQTEFLMSGYVDAMEELEFRVTAWVFPVEARNLDFEGDFFPGIIVGARREWARHE